MTSQDYSNCATKARLSHQLVLGFSKPKDVEGDEEVESANEFDPGGQIGFVVTRVASTHLRKSFKDERNGSVVLRAIYALAIPRNVNTNLYPTAPSE